MEDIFTVLSRISIVAGLLLTVLDVKNKVPVSLKTFIVILALASLAFSLISSVFPDDSQVGDNSKRTNTSSSQSDGAVNNNNTDDFLPAQGGATANLDSLSIDPIPVSTQSIEPITQISTEVPPIEMISFHGEIHEEDQYIDYEFVPQFSGIHRLEFSNVPDGTDFALEVYNSGWESIRSLSDLDNGDGLSLSLTAGDTYYLRVQQYRGSGSYSLNIGPKKNIVDVSNATVISDSIQYTDQENDYAYVAAVSGTYRFEFSDVPDGTNFSLKIYSAAWASISSHSQLTNKDGLTVSLTAGDTYYLKVQQYRGTGIYKLNIGQQKDMVNVSLATVISDSIQYTDQENNYTYVAAVSGTYRFEFSDVPDGTGFGLKIYNSAWTRIASHIDLNNGDGLTVSLVEGELYYVSVQQYRKLGSYSLNIGVKKPTVDISTAAMVSDSIQYTDQENDYFFSTAVDSTYRFEFANVPDGTYLRLKIYTSNGEKIRSHYGMSNGDELTVSLSPEKTYLITVSYYQKYGNYSLRISKQDS